MFKYVKTEEGYKHVNDITPSQCTNAIETGGLGWTVSTVGEVVVEETVYTSDTSGKICTTGLDIETPCVTYPNPGQMLCVCNGVECDVEVGYGHNDEYDENFYSMNITHNGEQVLYLWQLENNFYVINGNTPQPNQTVDFVIYSVDNEVNQIAEKYMPEKVSNAIETGGIGWTEELLAPITWDGDITTAAMITVNILSDDEIDGQVYCYKVSDAVLSREQLIGSQALIQYDGWVDAIEFVDVDIISLVGEDEDDIAFYPGWVFSASSAGTFTGSIEDDYGVVTMTVTVPEAGTYFEYVDERLGAETPQYTMSLSNEGVHQIDKKYLPSDISKCNKVRENEGDNYDEYPYVSIGEWDDNAAFLLLVQNERHIERVYTKGYNGSFTCVDNERIHVLGPSFYDRDDEGNVLITSAYGTINIQWDED